MRKELYTLCTDEGESSISTVAHIISKVEISTFLQSDRVLIMEKARIEMNARA